MEDKGEGEKRIGKEAWDRQGIEWRCKGWGIVIEEQNGHGRKCKGKMEDKGKGEN